ncbi:MAG TPA: metallophosphoesterase [Polyangiaceae bacterium]
MSHNQLLILYLPITACLPGLLSWYVGFSLLGPSTTRTACRAAAQTQPAHSVRANRSGALFYVTLVVMFMFGLSACLALVFWNEQDRVPSLRPLITWGFTVMATLLTSAALLLMRDAARGVAWLLVRLRVGRRAPGSNTPTLRYARCWRLSSWVILFAAVGCVIAGHHVAVSRPSVRHVKVVLQRLPSSFSGFRVAHLTDIHIHGRPDRERIRALVAQVNDLHVDLVAITGDVVDGALDDLRTELAALGALHAPYGVHAAVGNHEYYADVDACVQEFRRLGQTVLLNEHVLVRKGSDAIVIAGVTNPQRGMHGARFSGVQGQVARMASSPEQALKGAPPGVPRILLAHQPRSVAEARGLGVDLALTGHTHGGQFFPWDLAAGLVFPYATGLSREGAMQVFVGRGIGTFGPATRLGSAPEITVFELVPGSDAPQLQAGPDGLGHVR